MTHSARLTSRLNPRRQTVASALVLMAVGCAALAQNPTPPTAAAVARAVRNGDYIAAVVNQESVTAGEVERRVERAQAEASRGGQRLPAEDRPTGPLFP